MRTRTRNFRSRLTNPEIYEELSRCMTHLGFTKELERLNHKLFGKG